MRTSTNGRIRGHLRSNVVGYVAIFLFAIGGTAYATHPGGANTISNGDIINGQVFTQDLADNNLTSLDIRNDNLGDGGLQAIDLRADSVGASEISSGAVGSDEITDDTVSGADLAGSGFGNDGFNGDEEIIDGSITGFDIGGSELSGFHIANETLSSDDIAGFNSGAGQSASVVTLVGGGTDVATASITLEDTSQVIINGVAELTGAEADERAQCFITLDGSLIGLGYESTFDDIGTSNEATLAANSFANGVAPGAHTVGMRCFPLAGTIVKDDAAVNAIAIP